MLIRIGIGYIAFVGIVNWLNIRIDPIVAGLIGGVAIFVAVVWLANHNQPKAKKKVAKTKRRRKGSGK